MASYLFTLGKGAKSPSLAGSDYIGLLIPSEMQLALLLELLESQKHNTAATVGLFGMLEKINDTDHQENTPAPVPRMPG